LVNYSIPPEDEKNIIDRQNSVFEDLIKAQKNGQALGIYSVCSAQRFVLVAAFQQALEDGSPLLIEATCNQVNQFGGYTGMTPADFRSYTENMALSAGFPLERLILGGDHLGPHVWQAEPSEFAMKKARDMVNAYVQAGFTKIHLDASMPLVDDPNGRVSGRQAALRSAELCQAAETAAGDQASRLHYVIGTEVPPPGGAQGELHKDWISQPAQVQQTIDLTKTAFAERGLDDAWERVIAVVVQPGVEFSDQEVIDYRSELNRSLSLFIEPFDHLIYEAHSTDYQLPSGLRQLVADHFAILKVGPALTFALREAVFALARIEEESLTGRSGIQLSQVRAILENAMQSNPKDWVKYYRGEDHEVAIARKYSYSDRIRYYWSTPSVQSALTRLLDNLEKVSVPDSLISQYLPQQYWKIRNGELERSPRGIIQDKIQEVLQDYAYACGYRAAPSTRLNSGRSK